MAPAAVNACSGIGNLIAQTSGKYPGTQPRILRPGMYPVKTSLFKLRPKYSNPRTNCSGHGKRDCRVAAGRATGDARVDHLIRFRFRDRLGLKPGAGEYAGVKSDRHRDQRQRTSTVNVSVSNRRGVGAPQYFQAA
ncbi:MAG: hypothetical protein M3Y07_15730 [Acidobacteriota bacterium]|nr:hypothetical protein [Acidobacteriota bacterium]